MTISREAAEWRGALVEWARNGYRRMTMVHIGAHAALDSVPDKNLAELQKLLKGRDWNALKDALESGASPVNGSDYLSAAVRLRIVKKIFWIVPYPFFDQAGGGEQARQFLIDRGLVKNRSEAAGFGMAGGCLYGTVRDMEITICAPDTMHLIAEPVLLHLDSDFFSAFARSRGLTLLQAFKLTMDAMFERGYRIAAASIASSSTAGHFEPASEYMASQVLQALKEPSVLQQETAPPLWKARNDGDALLQKREFRLAYSTLKASIREFGPDKGLRALFAIAAAQQGRFEESLTEATLLCRTDGRYCPLFAHLATISYEKGRPDKAAVFLKSVTSRGPEGALHF